MNTKQTLGNYHKQARVLPPSMFMAQEPHIPSRHDLLNVSVGSISFLILISASSIIGPHLKFKWKQWRIWFTQCGAPRFGEFNRSTHVVWVRTRASACVCIRDKTDHKWFLPVEVHLISLHARFVSRLIWVLEKSFVTGKTFFEHWTLRTLGNSNRKTLHTHL